MGKGASKDAGKFSDHERKKSISTSTKKSILVFGGKGSLGEVIVRCYKNIGYNVITVDYRLNPDADHTVLLNGTKNEMDPVTNELKGLGIKYEAIVCVAGGFRTGNLKSEELLDDVEKMYEYNVKSAVCASLIATKFLQPNGILILTGAAAALNPTPNLLAYGMSKACTHHLVRSLAQKDSGMPEGSIVTAILPVILNTEQNRLEIPSTNYANWTPLETVVSRMIKWTNGNERPENGSMVVIKTNDNNTVFVPVKARPIDIDALE